MLLTMNSDDKLCLGTIRLVGTTYRFGTEPEA